MAGAHNPGPAWRRYLRFPTRVSLQTCGAAVRAGTMICTFSMYPAVRALYKEVPAFSTNRHFFIVCFAAGLDDLWPQVFLLVSVSFICRCACVGLLYRSSICACVTFILFVFREQKMVQRMQEIVAKYEDRLRKMQSVPRLLYGRRLLCTDGAPNRMFLGLVWF